MIKDNLNPLENVQLQIKSCKKLELDEGGVYEILKEPKRAIEISIPIKWMMERRNYLKDFEQFTMMRWGLEKVELDFIHRLQLRK